LGSSRGWSSSHINLTFRNQAALRSEIVVQQRNNKCTNNIINYEAILLGLCKLWAIGVQRCILHTDSKVVAGQIEKECIAREPTLENYLSLVRRMDFFSRPSPSNTLTETRTLKMANS
jgi:ribonuclease HI